MRTHRGTTRVELDGSLIRILEGLRKRVDPDYECMFRCRGGCEDTGWVVVDDGLSSEGKRVKAAVVRRCEKCGGKPARRVSEVSGGHFS